MQDSRRNVSRLAVMVVVAALITVVPAAAQTPTSGALLTIKGSVGTTQVNLSVSDAGIHSGTARTSTCDGLSTDAYVLQGGSPSGCDNGDTFETSQTLASLNIGGFHVTTFYQFGGCNTSGTICAGPDTGFLTVTNNTGANFFGTISLTGTSPVAGGFCPPNGQASDSASYVSGGEFPTPFLSGASVTLALSTDSSNCGGFSNASGTTVATQTAPPVTVTSGTTTDADFPFDTVQSQVVDHHVVFPNTAVFSCGSCSVNVLSSNILLSNSQDWPPYVIGTPFAPSQLFVKNGDNQGSNAVNDYGSRYWDKCYFVSDDPSTATDEKCPTAASNNTADLITGKDIFDAASKPTITPTAASPACVTDACTAALIHFVATNGEAWSPSSVSPNPVCTSSLGSPPSCDLADLINPTVSGDSTTISGGGTKRGSYVSVFNVPMLETLIKVNGTVVNTPGRQGTTPFTVLFQPSGSIQFTVNPAGCFNSIACSPAATTANNQFAPAPAASLNYKVTSGTTTVTSGTPTFDTTSVKRQTVTNNTSLNPGTYVISWSALDNVGIVEQNISQVPPTSGKCPDGSTASGSVCYFTSGFTTTVNVVGQLTFTNTKISITGTAFQITGGFSIPTATPGINPITQGLTLTLGNYTVTIPPNKFTMNKGSYVFQGNVLNPANSQLVNLQIQISPTTGTSFTLKVQASSGANPGTSHPLTLTIGPYSGTQP